MNVEKAKKLGKELDKYKKYQTDDLDLAYRCNRCAKIVLGYHIRNNPHRCNKCGCVRVEPIMQDLTNFGIHWCRAWVWYYGRKARFFSRFTRKVNKIS